MMTFQVKFSENDQTVKVRLSENNQTIGISFGEYISVGENYQGDYEVTPNESVQMLQTNGKRMTQDVIVNPIPSNYGRIEWNGLTLSVI